ncbi:MAG: flagellar biosynthetic protein FliR [Actinomycetales bacterium]
MNVDVPTQALLVLLLGSARAAAWLVVAPPFASRAVPGPVKALLSVALSLPLLGRPDMVLPATDTASVISAVIWQVFTGGALGFICYLVFAAVQTAGDLVDVSGGFALGFFYDPLMQSGNAVMGRMYQMTALTLLLASGGYLIVLQGFMASYKLVPLNGGLAVGSVAEVATQATSGLLLAAAQIAGPILAVLLLADIGLGLLTRAAPALNAFSLGFPLKILITLTVVGAALVTMPGVVQGLVGDSLSALGHVMGR